MKSTERRDEFSEHANRRRSSFVSEFVHFALQNKRWWMIPILVILLLLALLVVVTSTGAGALIYPLF